MYLVEFYLPVFSVRQVEAYQVAVSTLVPLPSTIVGAVGAVLGRVGYCKGSECLKEARRRIRLARAVALTVVKSPVILRRLRKVLEEGRLPADIKEVASFSDAMSREYVFAWRLALLIEGDVEREYLYLIDRLGDSESLVSIVDVAEVEPVDCAGRVNVVVKSHVARGGNYILVRGFDEHGDRSIFAVPLRVEGGLYKASEVEVDGPVRCVERGSLRAAFPGGYGW
jgi:CRISPR-associated protein Cas5 subtype I-A